MLSDEQRARILGAHFVAALEMLASPTLDVLVRGRSDHDIVMFGLMTAVGTLRAMGLPAAEVAHALVDVVAEVLSRMGSPVTTPAAAPEPSEVPS